MGNGLLVLSRKPGEKLVCTLARQLPAGTELEIVLLQIDRNKVRIGLRMPRTVVVLRDELIPETMGDGGNAGST